MKPFLIAAALCVLTTAVGAQSPGQVAIIGCQNAAVKEVRTQRPEADSVRFATNPTAIERSKREIGVHGSGQYLDRTRREWRPFMYECTYSTRSGATQVKLEIDSSKGT